MCLVKEVDLASLRSGRPLCETTITTIKLLLLPFWCIGLFFTLIGTDYPPRSTVIITNIRTFIGQTLAGASSSLVCVTSNVNTQCCRSRDGGNVGEWFFPNGTMVPRNSGHGGSDFTRSGFTHQVRLNRRNGDALMPIGEYSCRVPDESDSTVMHMATINLICKPNLQGYTL